jgi:hypothetical protein
MHQIVVTVDDDGTLLISVPPGALPLAELVTRAIQGRGAGAVEDEPPAPKPKRSRARLTLGGAPLGPLNSAVVEWIGQNECSAKEIAAGTGQPLEGLKKRLAAMVKAGVLVAVGGRSTRRYTTP